MKLGTGMGLSVSSVEATMHLNTLDNSTTLQSKGSCSGNLCWNSDRCILALNICQELLTFESTGSSFHGQWDRPDFRLLFWSFFLRPPASPFPSPILIGCHHHRKHIDVFRIQSSQWNEMVIPKKHFNTINKNHQDFHRDQHQVPPLPSSRVPVFSRVPPAVVPSPGRHSSAISRDLVKLPAQQLWFINPCKPWFSSI